MTTPTSGSTAAGTTPGYPTPQTNPASAAPGTTPGYQGYAGADQNYAVPPKSYGSHSGNMGTPTTDQGRPAVEGTSVGQLIGEVTKDLSTLMRQELELAKAELKVEAKKAGRGAGMFGAAGFAGYMTLLFLSIALWWALANVMDAGLAALIVAVLWAVIGAVTYAIGRKRFRQVNPKPQRTVETLQQVPSALKPN